MRTPFWTAVWRHLLSASWLLAWPMAPDGAGLYEVELPACCLVPAGASMVLVCLERDCPQVVTPRPRSRSAFEMVRPRQPIS
jgi:hypothetical protein